MKHALLSVSVLLVFALAATAQYPAPAVPLANPASRATASGSPTPLPVPSEVRGNPSLPAAADPVVPEEQPEPLPFVESSASGEYPELLVVAEDPVPEAPSRPWWAFWRSDENDGDPSDASEDPSEIAEPEPEPTWILETVEGTEIPVLINSFSFEIDAIPNAVPFSTDDFAALFPIPDPDRPGKFRILAPLARSRPFALVAPLPSTLKIRNSDGEKLSVPWADIVSLRDPGASATAPQVRASLDVVVTRDGADGPEEAEFPVAFVPFTFQSFSLRVPSWNIESLIVNPDRTVTLVSRFGDVLTGDIPLRKFDGFAKVLRVDFRPLPARFAPRVPQDAFRCRLRSGDVLVAIPDPEALDAAPLREPAAAPAARSIRSALVPDVSDEAPADCAVLVPLCRDAPLTIPGTLVEAVAAAGEPLPPATAPYSPSARITDEILVPAGSFHLGSAAPNAPANESPSVEVSIDPVFMSRTPVTVAQYAAFIADSGYRPAPEARSWDAPGFAQTPQDPVVAVSWRDAATYCNWLSRKAGLTPAYTLPSPSHASSSPAILRFDADGYRLPFEAEWEFAARGRGRPISFPWGDDASEETVAAHANFTSPGAPRAWRFTSPVLAYPPSPLGFYDLAGNAAEWCQDAYVPDAYATAYQDGDLAPILNPPAPTKRVIRGGSYLSPLPALRTTARAFGLELVGVPNEEAPRPRVGFRVVRNAP